MDVFFTKGKDKVDKPEIERVQKEKDEYKLIDTILRTRGLNLYAYSVKNDTISVIKVKQDKVCQTKIENGKMVIDKGKSFGECNIDTRDIHFEALNMKNAIKRVNKWKKGKIKELSNLRKKPESVNILGFV